MTRNKDFFRKPYMETPEDDYSDMMRYIPDAAYPDYRSKPHSEMIKPYDDRIRDYGEMEHFEPSNFNIPEQPPSVDAEPIVSGEPDPCKALRHIPFGAKQVYYKIPCGGSLHIDNAFSGGLPPYIAIASPGFMNGSLTYDEQGNFYYRAPAECCEDITDNIYIQDACGRSANIIIIVEAFDYLLSNYSTVIIGPDAPINGDCYYLQSPVPGTIWTIDKGSIDSSGCVSGIDAQCGVATITATFKCQENEIVATKQVRMPNGVWTSISMITHSCTGSGGNCYTYNCNIIEGILKRKWEEVCKIGPTFTGDCVDSTYCADSPPCQGCADPNTKRKVLGWEEIEEWQCP